MLDALESRMAGLNYCTTFGMDVFDHCTTLPDLYARLKKLYPDLKPEKRPAVPQTQSEFWELVNGGLDYRGDGGSGMRLTQKEEDILKIEQGDYKLIIRRYLTERTKIFYYSDEDGIPFYVVQWGFAFILLNEDRPSVFMYGAASD